MSIIAQRKEQNFFYLALFLHGQVQKVARLPIRIDNCRALSSASGGVSQAANGCAVHDSGQMCTFEGYFCATFRAFTTSQVQAAPEALAAEISA